MKVYLLMTERTCDEGCRGPGFAFTDRAAAEACAAELGCPVVEMEADVPVRGQFCWLHVPGDVERCHGDGPYPTTAGLSEPKSYENGTVRAFGWTAEEARAKAEEISRRQTA